MKKTIRASVVTLACLGLWACDSNPHARAPAKAPEQTQASVAEAPVKEKIELEKARWQPRQQALAMSLLDAPLRYAPGRYSQYMVPASDHSFPLLVGRKTGQPLAAAGSKDGRRYLAFGAVPVTYELASFHRNLKELVGWLVTGQSATLPKSGAVVAMTSLGSQSGKVKRWFKANMADLGLIDCEVLGLNECLAAADLLLVGGDGTQAQSDALVAGLDSHKRLPVLYFHTPHWKRSAFSAPILARLDVRQGEEGGNYWSQDAANWAALPEMFEMRLAAAPAR